MTCKMANEISLPDFLEEWGYKKIRNHRGGKEAFYENPIREDPKPSFTVNIGKNTWYDFGLGQGGMLVELIIERERTDVKGALKWLEANSNNLVRTKTKDPARNVATSEEEPRYHIINTKEIFSYGLKDYLEERGISLDIAKNHVKEIRFLDTETDKTYFSLGIPNMSGGYALRNKFTRTIIAPNDISFIPAAKTTGTVLMFEGLFDFLSYLMIKNTSVPDDDVIILNTLSYVRKAVGFINGLEHARTLISFLDNPKETSGSERAMEKALGLLHEFKGQVLQANGTYKAYEDLAEYWQEERDRRDIVLNEL
ncbi:hypothetical protein [Maribacter polysaccharolyticus]|uniref:hypothetical protein n=1 Tax=Maribacter polysaccharolyticus TaxID=3020831 RepID=UPI00237FC10B|nr:hypothetical protein [Maribacter polysaccharolyticus]MDE3744071.1 hypothetical protein [Maribacter polysaccharolyticus]